jgi:hypothetical protein
MTGPYFYRLRGMELRPDLNGYLCELISESNSDLLERVHMTREEYEAARAAQWEKRKPTRGTEETQEVKSTE